MKNAKPPNKPRSETRRDQAKPDASLPSLAVKPGLHPRNRHRHGYDFARLIEAVPELSAFVSRNRFGNASIDFANAIAVKTLNRALLKAYYRIDHWQFPSPYLCPPIPGRVDYVHYLADLIGALLPANRTVRVLDIGVGANAIYPLLGHREYGWHFVGADIDANAINSAQNIIDRNTGLAQAIELRLQRNPLKNFSGVIHANESFDATMCNPPFHRSAEDAATGTARKWRNLSHNTGKRTAANNQQQPHSHSAPNLEKEPLLNFSGVSNELWCQGGERAFIERMIDESVEYAGQCLWFTCLVSKAENLVPLKKRLVHKNATQIRVIDMAQGQKQSRMVAWSFA